MNGLFADLSNNNPGPVDMGSYREKGKHILLGHKATEGLGFVDSFHATRADTAHRRGIWVLHYHFGHVQESPQVQAEFFWANTHGHFARLDFCSIDTERGKANEGIPVARLAQWTNEYAAHLKKISGHSVIPYSNQALLEEMIRAGLNIPGGRAWIAAYGSVKPAIRGVSTWAWQYTDGLNGLQPHRFEGVGRCDGSKLNNATFLRLAVARKPR